MHTPRARRRQAEALAALGNLEARNESWRIALDAYHASLDRKDDPDVRAVYEDLREKHGFRILDYKVDNEAANPRVCFNFSDPLARKTDFTPYVAVAGATNAAISNEDQQLCVEGLKHGERYAIVIRQGLPSSVGESLLKNADYEIYVKDRSPQAHFAGRAYVLPRLGQLGAPLTTVNTSKVSVDVYRVGDRNLLSQIAGDDFLKPISSGRAAAIESQDGAKVVERLDGRRLRAQQGRRHRFSAQSSRRPSCSPGLYLVTAKPWTPPKPAGAEEDSVDQLATQWMVISDLGLTALSGADGVHAIVRSLSTAAPLAGVELRLVARNNEVLATKTTGADGRVDFDPGLSRGTGGLAPALAGGDARRRLRLPQSDASRLRSHRPRRRRPRRAGAARRLPLHRARRLSLRRDRLCRGPAARRQGRGQDRPAADARSSSAPTASNTSARRWPIRASAAVRSACRWRATRWPEHGRSTLSPIPRRRRSATRSSCSRIMCPSGSTYQLKPGVAFAVSGEPIPVSLDARFLYGAPAAGLDVTGAIRLKAVDGAALPGHPGYRRGPR